MQMFPSTALSNLVRHYLYVESNTIATKTFRLFPDGNTGIVFSFKNRLISRVSSCHQGNQLPASFIYGPINNFKNIGCVDETSLLIVVFHPYGLHQLLGIPAHELIDEIINIEDHFGMAGAEVTERLVEQTSLAHRIKIIESFLIKVLLVGVHPVHPLVLASIELIIKNRGFTNVKQLVHHTGYTDKSIQRRFMEFVGIFPKQFTKIIKLNQYLKGLRDNKGKTLFNLAYENGYYDHSHVTKDFKQITGVTPKQYVREFNALALNLLEFPKKEDQNI